jgi:RNA polymerase primary sigma factor
MMQEPGVAVVDVPVLGLARWSDPLDDTGTGADGASISPEDPANGAEDLSPPGQAPPVLRPDDELVTRCLDDLIDDWRRKGGQLSYEDVTRMSTKRSLDGLQLASLLQGLTQAGVTVSGLHSLPSEESSAGDLHEGITDDAASADRDIVGMYLAEIARYPLLWAEDEVRLGRLIKAGQEADFTLAESPRSLNQALIRQLENASHAGRRAHDELVLSNLRLVVSIAKRRQYANSGVDFIDRIQDGNIGLMHAADKFDYTKGYKFSTYGTWWIRQSIERGIADRGRLIRLPVHFHEQLRKVVRAQRRLAEMYGREPAVSELAAATGTDPATVQAILDWARPVESLDRVLVQDGDVTLGDLLDAEADVDGRGDPADTVVTAARLRDINKALDEVLDPRSAFIIRCRFGIGTGAEEETLEEIGKKLRVTRERVRQLEATALEMLAARAVALGLYEYLVAETRRRNAVPPAGWSPSREERKKTKEPATGRRQQARERPVKRRTAQTWS